MQSLRELNEQISEAQKALEHYAGRRFTAPSTCQDWWDWGGFQKRIFKVNIWLWLFKGWVFWSSTLEKHHQTNIRGISFNFFTHHLQQIKDHTTTTDVDWKSPLPHRITGYINSSKFIQMTMWFGHARSCLGLSPCPTVTTRNIFFVGDPNLNLHLPLASWEGGQSKSYLRMVQREVATLIVLSFDGVPKKIWWLVETSRNSWNAFFYSGVMNREWYYFQMEIVGTPGKWLYIYTLYNHYRYIILGMYRIIYIGVCTH